MNNEIPPIRPEDQTLRGRARRTGERIGDDMRRAAHAARTGAYTARDTFRGDHRNPAPRPPVEAQPTPRPPAPDTAGNPGRERTNPPQVNQANPAGAESTPARPAPEVPRRNIDLTGHQQLLTAESAIAAQYAQLIAQLEARNASPEEIARVRRTADAVLAPLREARIAYTHPEAALITREEERLAQDRREQAMLLGTNWRWVHVGNAVTDLHTQRPQEQTRRREAGTRDPQERNQRIQTLQQQTAERSVHVEDLQSDLYEAHVATNQAQNELQEFDRNHSPLLTLPIGEAQRVAQIAQNLEARPVPADLAPERHNEVLTQIITELETPQGPQRQPRRLSTLERRHAEQLIRTWIAFHQAEQTEPAGSPALVTAQENWNNLQAEANTARDPQNPDRRERVRLATNVRNALRTETETEHSIRQSSDQLRRDQEELQQLQTEQDSRQETQQEEAQARAGEQFASRLSARWMEQSERLARQDNEIERLERELRFTNPVDLQTRVQLLEDQNALLRQRQETITELHVTEGRLDVLEQRFARLRREHVAAAALTRDVTRDADTGTATETETDTAAATRAEVDPAATTATPTATPTPPAAAATAAPATAETPEQIAARQQEEQERREQEKKALERKERIFKIATIAAYGVGIAVGAFVLSPVVGVAAVPFFFGGALGGFIGSFITNRVAEKMEGNANKLTDAAEKQRAKQRATRVRDIARWLSIAAKGSAALGFGVYLPFLYSTAIAPTIAKVNAGYSLIP